MSFLSPHSRASQIPVKGCVCNHMHTCRQLKIFSYLNVDVKVKSLRKSVLQKPFAFLFLPQFKGFFISIINRHKKENKRYTFFVSSLFQSSPFQLSRPGSLTDDSFAEVPEIVITFPPSAHQIYVHPFFAPISLVFIRIRKETMSAFVNRFSSVMSLHLVKQFIHFCFVFFFLLSVCTYGILNHFLFLSPTRVIEHDERRYKNKNGGKLVHVRL